MKKTTLYFILTILIFSCNQPTKEEIDAKLTRLLSVSDSLNSLKEFNEALEIINEAIDLKDTIPYSYIIKGNSYLGLKKYKKANKNFTKAIELEGNKSYGYLYRAKSNLEYEEYDDFLSDINNFLRHHPMDTAGLTLRSNYNLKVNKKSAISDLWVLYNSDTTSQKTVENLAKTYYELNEKQKSLVFYDKFYKLIKGSKKDTIQFLIAKINFEIKNNKPALLNFLSLEEKGKFLDSSYFYISEILIREKKYNESIVYLDKKIKTNISDYESYFKKATLFKALGESDLAINSSLLGLKAKWKTKNIFSKSIPLLFTLIIFGLIRYIYFKKFHFEDYDRKTMKTAYLHYLIIPMGLHNIYLNFPYKNYIHSVIILISIIYFSFEANNFIFYPKEILSGLSQDNTSIAIIKIIILYLILDLISIPFQTFISNQKEREILNIEYLKKEKVKLEMIEEDLKVRNNQITTLFIALTKKL